MVPEPRAQTVEFCTREYRQSSDIIFVCNFVHLSMKEQVVGTGVSSAFCADEIETVVMAS
jgi:hypothetical protein